MAIHNFYDKYTINDANFGCQRVIVADCPDWNNSGSHRYASLCELLENCPWVKQLTRPCIVDALNNITNLNGFTTTDPNKRFLRVTSNGCLEIASPCVCNDWDRLVAASRGDQNPGTLDSKVKWSCSHDWLYCIDIEEAWPQTLVWRPSGPNGPFINPKMPTDKNCAASCFDVKLCNVWGKREVDYQCPEESNKTQYLLAVWTGGKTAISCKGRTVRYYAKHRNSRGPIDAGTVDTSDSYFDGDWVIRGTEAFGKPKSYGVFTINEPWVYNITYSCYVTGKQTCNAIRAGLWHDAGWAPVELADFKYDCGEVWLSGMDRFDNPPFNRLWPDQWNKEKMTNNYTAAGWTLEQTGFSFSRSYNLNVRRSGVEIYLTVKPDMRTNDPRVKPENDYAERYMMTLEGADGNAYGAATSIQVVKISESVPESRLLDISV